MNDLSRVSKATMATACSLARFGITAAEAYISFQTLAREFDRIAQEMRPDFIEALDLERQIRHWYIPATVLLIVLLVLVVTMEKMM